MGGEVPPWYVEMQEAELLGVKPWELKRVPSKWRIRARIKASAEHRAREDRRRRGH